MSASRFVRKVPFPVTRLSQEGLGGPLSSEKGNPSRFVRTVPVPPAPFQLERPLQQPIPAQAEPISPVKLSIFLARVNDDLGELLPLTLWELPSWRALESTLDLSSLNVAREVEGPYPPLAGDLLWIWTWTDQPPDQPPVDRIFVRVERRQLTEQERQRAGVLAEEVRLLSLARDREGET